MSHLSLLAIDDSAHAKTASPACPIRSSEVDIERKLVRDLIAIKGGQGGVGVATSWKLYV